MLTGETEKEIQENHSEEEISALFDKSVREEAYLLGYIADRSDNLAKAITAI